MLQVIVFICLILSSSVLASPQFIASLQALHDSSDPTAVENDIKRVATTAISGSTAESPLVLPLIFEILKGEAAWKKVPVLRMLSVNSYTEAKITEAVAKVYAEDQDEEVLATALAVLCRAKAPHEVVRGYLKEAIQRPEAAVRVEAIRLADIRRTNLKAAGLQEIFAGTNGLCWEERQRLLAIVVKWTPTGSELLLPGLRLITTQEEADWFVAQFDNVVLATERVREALMAVLQNDAVSEFNPQPEWLKQIADTMAGLAVKWPRPTTKSTKSEAGCSARMAQSRAALLRRNGRPGIE